VRAVGEVAVAVVSVPDSVEIALLQLVSADEAAKVRALEDPQRISGYPIIEPLSPLRDDEARTIAQALLDWRNYDPSWRYRCKIGRLLGLRFKRGTARVDIAISDPCWLVMWTFERDRKTERWSSPFDPTISREVFGSALRE
jgi:hypothetical protein